jgi:hypothetical protein
MGGIEVGFGFDSACVGKFALMQDSDGTVRVWCMDYKAFFISGEQMGVNGVN